MYVRFYFNNKKNCLSAFKSCIVYNTSNSALQLFDNDVCNESFLPAIVIDKHLAP